jgi:lysophospholipase L1-like esterase
MRKDPLFSTGKSYFSYQVDDGNWTTVEGIDGTIQLASGLDLNSEHTVRFGKSNEPQDSGIFDFDHLELDEGFTAAQPPRKLVYQAIGDSITAGYRALCPPLNNGGSSCGSTAETENEYSTYVKHLAEAWGTDDWSAVAVSGVCVAASRSTGTGCMPHTILDYYKCREFMFSGECQHPWDSSMDQQKPDVITINVGTNDYALTGENPPDNADFQSNYVELVHSIQDLYPEATIFVIAPLQWTINGARDGSHNMWDDMHDNVKAVVDTIASDKVIYVPTGDLSHPPLVSGQDYSDNTHPTVEGHMKFAKFLEEFMTPVIRQNYPELLPQAEQAQAQPIMIV